MFGISALFSLVILIIDIFVLFYIDNLEKIGCKCATDWRKTYAYAYLIISIVYSFIAGFVFAIMSSSDLSSSIKSIVSDVMLIGTFIIILGGILYIIFSLQYIHHLKDIKCKCSKGIVRDVWEIMLYIYAALMVLGSILGVISFFTSKHIAKDPYFPLHQKNEMMKSLGKSFGKSAKKT